MNNDLKNELEKIEIPYELHGRTKIGVAKANRERLIRKFKKPLVAAGIVTILGIGALASPSIQAALEGIFEVSKYDESSHQESISFGHGFEETEIEHEETYTTIAEIEKTYDLHIPFPKMIQEMDTLSNTDEFRVGVDKEANFVSYNVEIATNERTPQRFFIEAVKSSKANVQFDAQTEDGTAINKDIIVNDANAKLFGVNELAYSIYLERDGWKFIISAMVDKNQDVNTKSIKTKEAQLIKLAESIQ